MAASTILPLAVELAAARATVLSPAQILERLSQRLDLLKGGRDADPRQQTLRATIEWSYELLSPAGKQLFARLAVFAGGCTLAAAEEVCDADLDTLQSLVEKSLVRFTNERYWMLETVLEYAREVLDASNELARLCRRQADHVMEFAARARIGLKEGDRGSIGDFQNELDNIRAALAWLGQEDFRARNSTSYCRSASCGAFAEAGMNGYVGPTMPSREPRQSEMAVVPMSSSALRVSRTC